MESSGIESSSIIWSSTVSPGVSRPGVAGSVDDSAWSWYWLLSGSCCLAWSVSEVVLGMSASVSSGSNYRSFDGSVSLGAGHRISGLSVLAARSVTPAVSVESVCIVDGTDGMARGRVPTVTSGSTMVTISSGRPLSGASLVVSVGVPTVPSSRNPHFVKSCFGVAGR